MSGLARALLVTIVGAWALGTLVPEAGCILHSCPSNGLSVDYDGFVTAVDPGSPAAHDSIAPGDRIPAPFPRGLFLKPPRVLTLTVERDGSTRHVTLVPQPATRSRSEKLRFLALCLSYLIFLVVGSAVLLLRPSAMTWAFYLYCVLRRFGDLWFYWPGSTAIFWFNFLTFAALGGASCALVAIFALRFPSNKLVGWRKQLNRAALVLAVTLPIAWLYVFVRVSFLGLPGQSLVEALVLLTSIVYLGAAAIFVVTLWESRGDQRQRMRWILVLPAVLFLRVVVINLPSSSSQWLSETTWFADALAALAVLIPLSVAYAVVRRRVFDVEFAISRAIVYAAITFVIAGLFLLLDWFMSKQFAQTRFTLTAEIILALAIGSWLNMLHRNVDRFVDSAFFRQRHLAEQRLAKSAAAVLRGETREVVDRFLVHEPLRALDLTSAAVFRRGTTSAHFAREMAVGWTGVRTTELTPNDPLVLHLLAESSPVRLADVVWPSEESLTPLGDTVLAMPVFLRDQLVTIALYGPHNSGADIDPDEVRSIALLVDRAGAAYDHIEARMLAAQVETLMRERDAQRREIETLRGSTAS